jgi:hypothetical protein
MGLTIHYSGRFKFGEASLIGMIEEVKDVAIANKWDHYVFDQEFPAQLTSDDQHDGNLYGIMITPPESEAVSFSFLSNGRMCGVLQWHNWRESTKPEEKEYLYSVFTKTQFAGPEIHKSIVHLFDHISKKYLKEFSVYDEGNYWESRDEAKLKESFDRHSFLINSFKSYLDEVPKEKGETLEEYILRMAELVKKKEG